jgi:hypothetical protein
MHFRHEDYFQTLKDVAAEARTVPAWADYAAFCEEYERGLRREAFDTLERFTSSIERAPFAERQRFVSWLSQRADRREGRHMMIPHHSYVRIVEPTLLEWTAVEPDCSEPHLWLGGYDHVKRAFELEPDNQLARRKLLLLVWGRVDFEAYENGWSTNFDKDLATLSEVEELLKGVSNEEDRLKQRQNLQRIGDLSNSTHGSSQANRVHWHHILDITLSEAGLTGRSISRQPRVNAKGNGPGSLVRYAPSKKTRARL